MSKTIIVLFRKIKKNLGGVLFQTISQVPPSEKDRWAAWRLWLARTTMVRTWIHSLFNLGNGIF